MQQIRFDFLSSVSGGNGRGGNAKPAQGEPRDGFAQILDRQLTRRADAVTARRAEPRPRSDAPDRAEGPRPQEAKRRAPKPNQPVKSDAAGASCAKPVAKPESDEADHTTEPAAGAQATTQTGASTVATEAEDNSETPSDTSQQQQDEGAQQQPGAEGDQTETATAAVDVSLLAMLAVPLPLPAFATDADVAADVTAAGGGPAPAVQAPLAASLAGSIDLTAPVDGKGKGESSTGGLKFGAVLNASLADPRKAGIDVTAALQDAAEELAKAADPVAQPAPGADGKSKAPTAKPRDAAPDKAAASVNLEQSAKASASVVQPMAKAQAVTWSGPTNVRNALAESMAIGADARFGADEAEFSNWSQFLGSGASSLNSTISARQSAFVAQLKQNLQILPPHEQIAVQIRDAMQNGNSRLTVALHPAELGRVEVKLDIDKDKNVTATVLVDRPATLDLLRNDAKALERALQDAGLQTGSGSLSFNLRDSSGQDGSAAQNGSGTGGGSGQGNGAAGSDVRADARADVVATADGYVDLET